MQKRFHRHLKDVLPMRYKVKKSDAFLLVAEKGIAHLSILENTLRI